MLSFEYDDVNAWLKTASLDDARKLRDEQLSEIQRIQNDLGDRNRNRTSSSGLQMTTREYNDWRKRATYALNKLLVEYRCLRGWVKREEALVWKGPVAIEKENHLELRPTDVARLLRDMVGQLYAVFLAVGEFVDDPIDEMYEKLADCYSDAEEKLEGFTL